MSRKIIMVVILLLTITILNAQVIFQEEFSFPVPQNIEGFKVLQLFDYSDDGADDIIIQYWNNDDEKMLVKILDQNGNNIGEIQFNGVEDYWAFATRFYHNLNEKYCIYSYGTFNDDKNRSLVHIILKHLTDFSTIDSTQFEPCGLWGSPNQVCYCESNNVPSFFIGYERGGGDSRIYSMRKYDLLGDSLSYVDFFDDCGSSNTMINDSTFLSVGRESNFYPPTGFDQSFCLQEFELQNQNPQQLHSINGSGTIIDTTFIYNEYPIDYQVITRNDPGNDPNILQYIIQDTDEGISVHFKGYDTSTRQLLWTKTDTQIGLGNITASTCIKVNDEDHYVMYFRGDKLEIRNRVTGNIVHHQDSVLAVCEILKKSDGELLFFVEKDDETGYDVYTLDGPIFVSNDELPAQNQFVIEQYPNPFKNQITFSFKSKEPIQNAEIKIYNIKGQLVKTISLFSNPNSGTLSAVWDGCDENGIEVKQGIYLYTLNMNWRNYSDKIIKIR